MFIRRASGTTRSTFPLDPFSDAIPGRSRIERLAVNFHTQLDENLTLAVPVHSGATAQEIFVSTSTSLATVYSQLRPHPNQQLLTITQSTGN